jgi:2-polyprenyl-3-methyl-5-hydroxy-6-metoxy-1,4-benzoquinol methylase
LRGERNSLIRFLRPGRTILKNNRETGSKMSTTKQIPSIEDQRRFWNWHWEHRQERKIINDWTLRRGDAILEILRSLSLHKPEILDFGCGEGWFTDKLALLGEASGIDLSEEAIAVAKSRSPQITFIAGNVYDFPLLSEKYDVVVSQEVITHVEDQSAYLERAASVLKSEGYLIIACANKFVMDRLGRDDWNAQPPEHISWYPSMKDLKSLLRPKFKVLHATTILPIGTGGILRIVNSYKLNRVLEWFLPRRILEDWKGRAGFGYQLLVLAKKLGPANV